MTLQERIAAAFAASPPEYLDRCLAQRNPGAEAAGSQFLAHLSLDDLRAAEWQEYTHPDIQSPAYGFQAPIRGRLGIVALLDLDPEATVTLCDPKSTGAVEAVVAGVLGQEVDFTVLILGPHEGKEVVYTFFPGKPIQLSQVSASDFPHGTQMTVGEALKLGMRWAKVG